MEESSSMLRLLGDKTIYAFYAFVVGVELILSPSWEGPLLNAAGCVSLPISIYLAYSAWAIHKDKKELFNISKVFRALSSAEGFQFYDACGALALIAMLSWTCDAVAGGKLLLLFIQTVNLFTLLVLFHKCYPMANKLCDDGITSPAKYLYFCLPTFTYNHKIDELTQLLEGEDPEVELKGCSLNWAPLLRVVWHHSEKLERVFILTSKESLKQYSDFVGLLNLVKEKKTVTFLPDNVPDVDVNDAENIVAKTGEKLNEYKVVDPKDVCFYISSGTSAVSAAFMLMAVRNRYQAEYIEQKFPAVGCGIFSININASITG